MENQRGGGRQGGQRGRRDVAPSLSQWRAMGREEDIGESFGEEAWQDRAF